MRRYVLALIAGVAVGLSLAFFLISDRNVLDAAPAPEASQCRAFPQTGKSVCGKFLQYWQQHGGLAQFGLPISYSFIETSPLDGNPYTVQYFERAEFELHPENKPPYDLLLVQLGTFRFNERYSGSGPQPLPYTPVPVPTPMAGKGVITGKLGFPSEVIPQLYVYAIEVNGAHYYSLRTNPNQLDYAMGGIEPGTYYVVVYAISSVSGDQGEAGYTQAVLCGLRFTCTDHTLVEVRVATGAVSSDVNVTDFTSPRGGFPKKP
ncbi:MAG: hypothetical protein ABI670_14625 [Chloroflexota bacterium]